MKKIPTIFERDWAGDKSRVVNIVNPEAAWVFAGEGCPMRKIDGTSCMIRNGKLFKRRELRTGDFVPPGFELVDKDDVTGKGVGWVPVGDGPEDRGHRDALAVSFLLPDGTYELLGPKVQGNPEKFGSHMLVKHDNSSLAITDSFERSFEGIAAFLAAHDMEGIVFHHPDGHMAKIKGRDFGLKRVNG